MNKFIAKSLKKVEKAWYSLENHMKNIEFFNNLLLEHDYPEEELALIMLNI